MDDLDFIDGATQKKLQLSEVFMCGLSTGIEDGFLDETDVVENLTLGTAFTRLGHGLLGYPQVDRCVWH